MSTAQTNLKIDATNPSPDFAQKFDVLVKEIDANIWFHTLYGLLDGLSVSYSTFKFMCDLYSSSVKDYHENLENILTDLTFWIPLMAICTLTIASISLLHDHAKKTDNINLQLNLNFAKEYWPYIRDILKGSKNGYKGIKNLATILIHQQILSPHNLRNFALPIGLSFGAVAIFNRIYIRNQNNKYIKLNQRAQDISKQYILLTKSKNTKQKLHEELFDTEIVFKRCRFALEKHTNSKRVHLKNKLRVKQAFDNLKAVLSTINTKQALENFNKDAGTAGITNYEKANAYYLNTISNNNSAISNALILDINFKKITTKRNEILSKIKLEEKTIATIDIKRQLEGLKIDQKDFLTEHGVTMKIAKALGGILDGPYLYLGIMSLATISGPAIVLVNAIIASFLVCCIAIRINEELEQQKSLKTKLVHARLQSAIHSFTEQQNILIQKKLKILDECEIYRPSFFNMRVTNTIAMVNSKFSKYLEIKQKEKHPTQNIKVEFDKLHQLLNDINPIVLELKNLIKPNQQTAILDGIKDGLAMFGALTSTYFAASIVLMMLGQTLPAVFVVGGVIFGLLAIATGINSRLYQAQENLSNWSKHFADLKEKMELNLYTEQARKEYLLSPFDCNTDGLTKGEFAFQNTAEVIRCLTNGPYKSQNLTDFFFSRWKEHTEDGVSHNSHGMFLFWIADSIVYSLCLAIRAYGKAYKNYNISDKKPSTNPAVWGSSSSSIMFKTNPTTNNNNEAILADPPLIYL